MRLIEVSQPSYHPNIRSWVIKAKSLSVEQITHILHDEGHRDPDWFISKRGNRLRQLVSEIMTLALKEVSDEKWSETDFEGHAHSDLLSQAISDVTSIVTPVYHQIRTQLLSQRVKQNNNHDNSSNQEEINHVEQTKIH